MKKPLFSGRITNRPAEKKFSLVLKRKIAEKEFGFEKIAVISGVGARNYWRKLGYRLKETYVVKKSRR